MKKLLLLLTILAFSVFTTACINNLAVQELNNKAAEYIDKGDAEAAICRLKASLDLDGGVYQTHYNLAAAYNAAGKYEEAQKEAYKALELKPDLYDAYYIAAAAKESSAYKALEEAESKAENSSNETASAFAGEFQAAADAYKKYLEHVPDAPEKQQIEEKIAELNEKINRAAQQIDNAVQEEAGF